MLNGVATGTLTCSNDTTGAASRCRHPWLAFACIVLPAYALMGKGAAYIGAPPLFIGELLMLCGLGSLVLYSPWRCIRLPGLLILLLVLAAWGLCRTIPFVRAYGMEALRDAVLWGYAAFAFIMFYYVVAHPERLLHVLRRYGQFASIYVLGMPCLWGLRYILGDRIPRWPWADVPVIDLKAGDVMVHLGGILAFWVAGPVRGIGLWRLVPMTVSAAVIGAYERAGMFAFAMAFLLCSLFRPGHKLLHHMAAAGVGALVLLAVTGIQLDMPVAESSKIREISFAQFVQNILSTVGASDMGDLDDTKHWRLNWWGEIVGYTLKGSCFWTGKGFGVNLADDDGFQVMADHSLRSPHNAHLTMLARAGVPGLAIWTLAQFGFAWALFAAIVRTLRAGEFRWAGLFLFVLAYWSAFMVNATFDVFLEGPMGGIWFWCLYGLGLAALWIHRHQPDLLYHEDPDCTQLLSAAGR